MHSSGTVTAFAEGRLVASGSKAEVARAIKETGADAANGTILVFADETGAQVDLDLRLVEPEPSNGLWRRGAGRERAGRPKLGVVAREVTLLPRHWDWLASQSGGASVTLRKLVEAARRAEGDQGASRRAREAADRFMGAMLGNAPHYEDASRALYRGERCVSWNSPRLGRRTCATMRAVSLHQASGKRFRTRRRDVTARRYPRSSSRPRAVAELTPLPGRSAHRCAVPGALPPHVGGGDAGLEALAVIGAPA